jgi:hypothetical protein
MNCSFLCLSGWPVILPTPCERPGAFFDQAEALEVGKMTGQPALPSINN